MKITIDKKMKLRIEPRKIGEEQKDYRKYIEDCFYEQFPKKLCTCEMLNKIERASYEYSYEHDGINFCGKGIGGILDYFSRKREIKRLDKENKNEVKENETKESKNEVKKTKKKKSKTKNENKVVGFFKNLFGKKKKNTEETFEENLPELIELGEDDLPDLEETFEENIHDDDIIDEENLPEERKEKTAVSLPIETKSSRDLNKEEASKMSVMAQLRYLQEQNKKQEEIIKSTINNFNVYLENFKKLEQENLRLRKEITRLSYNPNSFVIKNAYEEAVKEDRERTMNKIYNSFVNDSKDYIHDDLTANKYNIGSVSFIKDENQKNKILTKYYDFKNNSTK